MELTPEDMAQRIDRAARQARESDASELHQAQECFDKGTYELRGIASPLRTVDDQRRHLLCAVAGGTLDGCTRSDWSLVGKECVHAGWDAWSRSSCIRQKNCV